MHSIPLFTFKIIFLKHYCSGLRLHMIFVQGLGEKQELAALERRYEP